MRTVENILEELEGEERIIHPHLLLNPSQKWDDYEYISQLLNRITQPGLVSGIFGGSGMGKSWTASTLIWILARMGKKVIHNLPIEQTEYPNIIRETLMSELTLKMANEPMDNGMPMVIVIDEATLRASGSLGGMNKQYFTFNTWVNAFMRKLGGGKGACLIIIFQHSSQMGPMFRGEPGKQNGLLYAEITKISHTAMLIDFPNDKGKLGFDLPSSELPIMIMDIPPPCMLTHSFGPSSFEVDFDVKAMDEWIARRTRTDASPAHYRQVIREFFEKKGVDGSEGAKGGMGARDKLEYIKSLPSLNTTDRLVLLEKIFSRAWVEGQNQSEMAKIWGVSPSAMTKAKKTLGWTKEGGCR